MNRRGKVFVLSTAAVGVVVLVGAGIAFRCPILEEWYLRDLATSDKHKSESAADWFGRHGSVRAMRRLFDVARELWLRSDAKDLSSGTCKSIARIGEALQGIAIRRGSEVVPLLVRVLKEKPTASIPGNDIRCAAAGCLAAIGADAREALPALCEAQQDDDERFCMCAADALIKIQKRQTEAHK